MAIARITKNDNQTLVWSEISPSDGDLVVLFFYNDGGDNQSPETGFTRFDSNGGSTMEAGAYYRICDGLETGNIIDADPNFGVSREGYNCHAIIFRVGDWHGTTVPEAGTRTGSTSGTIDPPSLTPSGWDASAEDTIWIICGGRDDDDGISAASSGYSTNYAMTENNNQVEMATSWRIAAAATENPGIYTQVGTAEEWVAYTIAIRPAPAGASYFRTLYDDVGITDTLALGIGRGISLADPVGITDTLIVSREIIKAITDLVGAQIF